MQLGDDSATQYRDEAPSDVDAIHVVEALAFGRAFEADMVDALRDHGKVMLSLVAELAGEVVGHVLFRLGDDRIRLIDRARSFSRC
jgi:predicted N-acetyltransferase YhbS